MRLLPFLPALAAAMTVIAHFVKLGWWWWQRRWRKRREQI